VTEPRLILEVRYGKLAGTKAVVEPGRALRVGRTELADLVVAHDTQMSGAHFEIAWDGARCSLRDLGSISGTRLSGEAVPEAVVAHGGWIQAGETDFLVFVEGKTPPRRRQLEDRERAREEARQDAAERALVRLRAEAAPLYAVVDGARDRRILEVAQQHVEPHVSLYEGLQGETFEGMAPFLIGPMRADSELLDRLVREGFGNRWGIYCSSHRKLVDVRRHFRRFLMVEIEPTNEQVYFRFYDPGVFRVFWPTCSAGQRSSLADGLEEIFVEEKNLSLSALLGGAR
jgi:pSer/pThr/pTyr-binding forkhead associated (FHA) protein